MGRTSRDCPLCTAKDLLRLPNHLRDVHKLSSEESSRALNMASERSEDITDISTDSDTDGSESGSIANSSAADSIADSEVSDEETNSAMEEEDDEHEDDPWSDLIVKVFSHYQPDMSEAVTYLVKHDDMSRRKAESKVYKDFLPRINKRLRRLLTRLMCQIYELKKDSTYRKIVHTVKRNMIEDDMDYEEAVSQGAEIRKLLIHRLLLQWTPTFHDDSSAESSSDEQDSESSSEGQGDAGETSCVEY